MAVGETGRAPERQNFGVHFEDLMSSDGVPLDFDAVIRLQITNAVALIRDFGEQWFDRNVQAEFQNRVRQAVRQHGMNETAISTAAVEEIDSEVKIAEDARLEAERSRATADNAYRNSLGLSAAQLIALEAITCSVTCARRRAPRAPSWSTAEPFRHCPCAEAERDRVSRYSAPRQAHVEAHVDLIVGAGPHPYAGEGQLPACATARGR
jgi:hypothetical protein